MRRLLLVFVCAAFLAASPSRAQSSVTSATQSDQAQILHSCEAFIRNLFTWGPEYKIKLGPLASSATPDFYSLPIDVTFKGQSESTTFYVGKDGKTFIRGEMFDMSADPFAATRAKLHIDGNPSKGPTNARVTIVEFSDFECPHCREVHTVLQSVEAHYPQVRVVYKDFPLSQIHPWAETAAIGGRCAFQQAPGAFWKMHACCSTIRTRFPPAMSTTNSSASQRRSASTRIHSRHACRRLRRNRPSKPIMRTALLST
jgi:protein-disulfide isomerase